MKIFLIIYFVLFFTLAMALPTYRVWKNTGVNPYKLGASDSAHDYIGKIFRLVIICCFGVVLIFAFSSNLYAYFVPIKYLENAVLSGIGVGLLTIALVWVLIAQVHMQKSWRIGIDEDTQTELVQTGLFKISRNPIFLGMRLMLLGLFFIIPNAVTFAILISGELLIQIQARLEEEFLTRRHQDTYTTYQKQVRRWI